MVPIGDVKPYERNPRHNDGAVDAVKASIEEFGFRGCILVDASMTIIAGHTRLKAAKALGMKEVPVEIADDLTEDQVKALRLVDNKTSELSDWDDNLLMSELDSIVGIDMEEFGFLIDEDKDFGEPEAVEVKPLRKVFTLLVCAMLINSTSSRRLWTASETWGGWRLIRSSNRKHTDNAHLEMKRSLRRMATEGMESPRVLDLFGGYNLMWRGFRLGRYFGVEMVKGKGHNLHADNLRIIPSLDLGGFDVIDCDAYGSAIKQIIALYRNPTLRDGTVIVFTNISSPFNSRLPDDILGDLAGMYRKAPSLFGAYGQELFNDALARLGVDEYYGYRIKERAYDKVYGFFVVQKFKG